MNNELAEAYADVAKEFPYACEHEGCARRFKTPQALRMHDARVHSMKIRARGQGPIPLTAEQRRERELERRRIYQKKLRERYKREGKDSRGYPLKGTRQSTRTRAGKEDGRRKGGVTGMKLPSWSPERRAKFERTMRRLGKSRTTRRQSSKRIRFVYPAPGNAVDNLHPTAPAIAMRYCPSCGEHLEGWEKKS